MGNTSAKESRGPDSIYSSSHRHADAGVGSSGPASPTDGNHSRHPHDSRGGRRGRPDLSSILGIGSSSTDVTERRETKQEREARKLEKERLARIKERARSIKEEHVDGGYLVTMGVYTGHEDFSKPIIERRIAPFWRGLNDFKPEWTEHQLVAAGKGLPIPAADEIPQDIFGTPSPGSPHTSSQNLQNLMVPVPDRSPSPVSDASTTLSPSNPAFSLPSPTSQEASPPLQSSSPFRPRSKTLASLTSSSKTPPSTEMTPREIKLPKDPFVNGQRIEVYLYKDATECPICFMYYPPHLNNTRCCDQPICSECFVQIKRPDPHPPEHEHHDPSDADAAPSKPAPEADTLVSEPSTCPYCQQPEFGVIYDPPPFRRGLAYANSTPASNIFSSAMSSSSSVVSNSNPTPPTHRRRHESISANAPTVITTDKIRPDWATKLANARSHLARRSAAATALHTAAYLMGNANPDSRGFGFSSRSRFGRHRGDNSPGTSGAATPSPNPDETRPPRTVSEQMAAVRRQAEESSSRRRDRMEDLEEMMMMEAIRLSLAAEEERKRKGEKEAFKDAKKRAKEEKKREKKERKVYGSGASSASGSALSLSLPGLGRRRGNSGASNLGREVTPEEVDMSNFKGKGVDRGVHNAAGPSAPVDVSHGENTLGLGIPGGRRLDTTTSTSGSDAHPPSPSPTAPDKPSHLRQMSNASSPSSSFVESAPGSLRNGFAGHGSSSTLDSPSASGAHIARHSDETPDGEDSSGNAASEPMFNFQSLVAMIGDEKVAATDRMHLQRGESSDTKPQEQNQNSGLEDSVATLKVNSSMHSGSSANDDTRETTLLQSQLSTPEVLVTAETPAAVGSGDSNDKQLGEGWGERIAEGITQ
ncbi:Uncharacterized protein BP5553_02042 [Venustampulla echinocandica]|uniref:Protein sip5 n=1 Tax=Venustampulla echinocandica TaxID=2656787 RepID=A0A370U2W5_9HELO|nr:Uncharacterized protein BP5553_02042 [Venustampulla echinocandica]RDL42063.1 Uncharacterized protein BP5553_02042 [Venustampulla echinocandica]